MAEIETGGPEIYAMANAVRALAVDAVEAANSGHPGMPMGMADAATVLWRDYLKFDASDPHWPDRDRFILSAGHGSMLIYALLHLTGYARPTIEDIRNFRQLGSPCAGHPENFELPGVEVTTGPLGQGLAMAVGMAIAERHMNAVFGDSLVDHRIWVIAGDGCLQEGVSHEAGELAGHLKLGRLIVLWDDNRISIDGPTDLSSSTDELARFEAYGWHVARCDGHDPDLVSAAIEDALSDTERPSLIACRTTIGFGAPTLAGTAKTHGSPLGAEEVAGAKAALGWDAPPFTVPADIADAWRTAGARGATERAAWTERLAAHPERAEFERRMSGRLPGPNGEAQSFIADIAAQQLTIATRKASELALEALTAAIPDLLGGSADLTGSNNTRTKATSPLTADNYGGRYLHYGIREFGMAAAMNGMALHGGVVPYGGTFLVFADYLRPALRLSALQRARVVYVLTHDSIGLGEDGPTHQPVEHLASLRAIPNVAVFRPADAVETAECWTLALARADGPSVLALTRQNLPPIRRGSSENLSERGAYRLRAAEHARRCVLIATGSEVHLALGAADLLEAAGIGTDVVSMPCSELFAAQSQAYRDDILPNLPPETLLRVSIEAGSTFGWDRWTMTNGLRVGLDRFGVSAPGGVAFSHFGFTAEAIARRVRERLGA
ncbi:MAG: transketolase [Sphingomonadaceae bacterium]|nr:transketolase [Sphingomonadaceae bacterium]